MPARSTTSKRKRSATPKPRAVVERVNTDTATDARTSEVSQIDPFIDGLYKSHTISVSVVGMSFVLAAFAWSHSTSKSFNINLGVGASAWAFLLFAAVHFPDSGLIRPHPALWRMFLAVGVLYQCLMIFFLFQDIPTTRDILGYYDASLRTPLPERSYAEDCRISTPMEPFKFFTTVFDEFLIAHSLGYWAKTLVLRDWRIVTAVSVGFEIIEVTLQHILNNFKECWWDHLLIDILICNAGGTYLGYLTLRYLKAKRYDFVKLRDIRSLGGKAKRVLSQLTPISFTAYDWHIFHSRKRFLQVCFLLLITFTNEINCFTMKNMLWFKSTHHLVVGRLVLWAMIAVPAVRDFYNFCDDPNCKRLGVGAWVGASALFFETVWMWRIIAEGGFFRQRWPAHIVLPWLWCIAAFVIWTTVYFGTLRPRRRRDAARLNGFLNFLFYSIPVVFSAMFLMANVDIQLFQREFDGAAAALGIWT